MFTLRGKIYSRAAVRQIESLANSQYNLSSYELMHRAAEAAKKVLLENWPLAKNISIFCGPGNNGGDGLLLANILKSLGKNVEVILVAVGNIELHSEAFKKAYGDVVSYGIPVKQYSELLQKQIKVTSDVIVDAILGIGLNRVITGDIKSAIEYINNSGIKILALDIPSGLDADTGMVYDKTAVVADVSISFIVLKQGMFTGKARDYCGTIYCDNLNIDPTLYIEQIETSAQLLDLQANIVHFKRRKQATHKGNFGRVLIIGGDEGMAGAVVMAGLAALRAGSGLVTIATRDKHAAHVNALHPELMCYGVETQQQIRDLIKKASIVLIGPGLGMGKWGQMMLDECFIGDGPLVIDGDGLNLLAQHKRSYSNWVLTPHPKEAARLLATRVDEIENNRYLAIKKLQQEYAGVMVLKGSGTLIYDSEEFCVCVHGNPGMATAGTGDVLGGIIASLIGQGLPLDLAAKIAVDVHSGSADLVARQFGTRGLLATDLLAFIPKVLNGIITI